MTMYHHEGSGVVVFQRRGVSRNLMASWGRFHCEIIEHHGRGVWAADISMHTPGERPGLPSTSHRHDWIERDTFDELVRVVSEVYSIAIASFIEAYMFEGSRSLQIWPHVARDKYRAAAVYCTETADIQHPETREQIVRFTKEGKPVACYSLLTRFATKAIERIRHTDKTHTETERRAYLAWLIGTYAVDAGIAWVWRDSLIEGDE